MEKAGVFCLSEVQTAITYIIVTYIEQQNVNTGDGQGKCSNKCRRRLELILSQKFPFIIIVEIFQYAINLIKNFCPEEKQFFPSPTSSEIGALPGNHFWLIDLCHAAAMLSPSFVFARLNSFSSYFIARVDVQNGLFLS